MEAVAEELTFSLKRESRFFLGTERSDIQILTQVLDDLNGFLQRTDATLVDKLMKESVESWLEKTKENSEELKGHVEASCLRKLSKILQEPRVINFLDRATWRFMKLDAVRSLRSITATAMENGETRITPTKPFYSFIQEYVDSSACDATAWLMNEAHERSVLSLVGPDGIGKTALAKKLYDSEILQRRFDCRCYWVDVSRSFNFLGGLKLMIEQISQQAEQDFEPLGNLRTSPLLGILRQALREKRYMFVFAYVFQEEFWHVMKQALPDDGNGSRIIITTTSERVFESCKGGSFDRALWQEPLSETTSWELFSRIAFRDEPEMQCPTGLIPLSRGIIGMCKGFPLPTAGLAGLLSKKGKLASEWLKLFDNLKLEVQSSFQPPDVLEVLALSYRDLPAHLMPCFLYFSIFPEDCLIPNDKLFMLWIAEGFVEDKIGKTFEEVAEDYLKELILRGFVQNCQGFYGIDQFCRVDRLMHNLAREMADEIDFCQIVGGRNPSRRGMGNRLSIYNEAFIFLDNINSQVHSIFLFNPSYLSFPMVNLIVKCTVLTLLDFENYPIEILPKEVGNLYHLKYLSLKNTKVRKLPKSVQKLYNLQTLDVRNTLLIELPVQIKELKNLRHLFATGHPSRTGGNSTRGVRIKEGIDDLQNLHTLMTLEAHQSGFRVVKELAKLKQLRVLGVSGLTTETAMALCTCIDGFSHLQSLTLQAKIDSESLILPIISTPVPLLRHVVLKGPLLQIPEWVFRLQNLSTLCLSLSRLTEDPLIKLSQLPNLESLWLYKAFEGKRLCFEEGDFRKLMLLVIRELHGMNVLEIEDGALPRLEELRMGPAPLLSEVPSGFRNLRNLKVLVNCDMPNEYVVSMQPAFGSSCYWKVEHIPSVIFLCRVQGRNYKSFKLGDPDFLDHLLGLPTHTLYEAPKLHAEYDLSYCESEDSEEAEENVGQLSFSINQSNIPRRNSSRWSFSSGFYTDDFEE